MANHTVNKTQYLARDCFTSMMLIFCKDRVGNRFFVFSMPRLLNICGTCCRILCSRGFALVKKQHFYRQDQ